MIEIDGLYGKITKLVDGDDVVWKVGKDNVKEIEVGKMEDSNRHWAGIRMRDGSYKNLYGYMKSIKVEFD